MRSESFSARNKNITDVCEVLEDRVIKMIVLAEIKFPLKRTDMEAV